MRETQVCSLGWEDPLEKEMATHSSILAWRIPWTEEPGGLQSTGSQSRTRLVTSLQITWVVFLYLLLFESQGFKYLVFWAQKRSGRSQLGVGQLGGKDLCSVLSLDILCMLCAWITLYGVRIILFSKRISLKVGWFYPFQLQSLVHLWFQRVMLGTDFSAMPWLFSSSSLSSPLSS